MKAKKQKLNFKPTPISRLLRYKSPIKMVGDPDWGCGGKNSWHRREKAVYAYEMERKAWFGLPWTRDTWDQAHRDNERLDILIAHKWDNYETALHDNKFWGYKDACRENAAWDYHHEYAPDLEMA